MQPVEPTLHEEKVVHIFKLRDHCLCADTALWLNSRKGVRGTYKRRKFHS
jgi:hypothetical protein